MRNIPANIGRAAAIGAFIVFSVLWQPQVHGAESQAYPGKPAPAFTAPSIAGQTVRLADFAGKTVVLEWTNNGCPFVGKHYNSGNMQALQRRHIDAGGVWLVIASSAPGEQGYVTPDAARADLARWASSPSDFLLDPNGAIGHLYDAKVTPHMVVIDGTGKLAYSGAIDDKPSTNPRDVTTAKNYVAAALDEVAAGKPISIAATRAYGCTIKYKTS
jgi:AhpC/TSA family